MSKEENINNVTDKYVEDEETEAQNNLTDLDALQKQKQQAQSTVVVNTGDIDILVAQFEVDRPQAKQQLIDANGDLKAAIKAYISV